MLFGRKKAAEATNTRRILKLATFPAAIYAVGDIHGSLRLYNEIERQIVEDGAFVPGPKLILCLGDVVDRGAETAGLLDRLMGPAPAGFQRMVLRGNHEDMMLEFIKTPERHMNWVEFGGEETLASYGIRPDTPQGFRGESRTLKRKLDAGIPDTHISFLENLPIALVVGKHRFAHAGYSLGKVEDQQSSELLLWGPPEAADGYQGDEILVHGHTIVEEVEVRPNRINLDIGAYKTGRLAAMRFTGTTMDRQIFIADGRSAATNVV